MPVSSAISATHSSLWQSSQKTFALLQSPRRRKSSALSWKCSSVGIVNAFLSSSIFLMIPRFLLTGGESGSIKMAVEFQDGADRSAVMENVRKSCKRVESDCEIFI